MSIKVSLFIQFILFDRLIIPHDEVLHIFKVREEVF